jgi:hypothetical protein
MKVSELEKLLSVCDPNTDVVIDLVGFGKYPVSRVVISAETEITKNNVGTAPTKRVKRTYAALS